MTDSTASFYDKSSVNLTDILTQQMVVAPLYDAAIQGLNEPDLEGSVYPAKRNEHRPVVAEVQHAKNRADLRRLGVADARGTAEPEMFNLTNQYQPRTSHLDARIIEFLSYTEGWDGEDALEIPMDAIYSSLNFLGEVNRHFAGQEPKSAAPSPDGEIVLYWHSSDGYAEINFDGSGNLSMCWANGGQDVEVIEQEHGDIAELDKSGVWDALASFLQKQS